jgi:hypothetical protein
MSSSFGESGTDLRIPRPADPAPRATAFHHRQTASDGAQIAIERELSHELPFMQLPGLDLFRGRQHAQGNRQIEARPFLGQIGRRPYSSNSMAKTSKQEKSRQLVEAIRVTPAL